MMPSRTRPSRVELALSIVAVAALATLPQWTSAWWAALPFATAVGGIVGGRWLRWVWSFPLGFGAGALVWGLQLVWLPGVPRSRLADVLGAAQGVSATIFLLLGPVLFGLVAAVTAAALAGALRLATHLRGRNANGAAAPNATP
ncbi:MAG TPA: hypothetical protein VKT21_07490 [Thermoplasmata archaeon]|nr:hypothetical protein [Thermoplasmata archaeon]